MGSLEKSLGRKVEIAEAKEIIRDAIADLFDIQFESAELSATERQYERELLERYDNEEWFWANSIPKRFPDIPPGASIAEHALKIPNGPLVRARVLKTDDAFLDCSLTGWYHGVRPIDALEKVEARLKDLPLDGQAVLAAIEKAYQEEQLEIDQCAPEDLQKVIMQAL